ncbi:ribonuclease HII [Olleya aquimaris]|uniref:Uncharacterized protein n=1 Tax=Olleya aquimaris TaxID=639310 RepID=A0A327RE17_9FLAO|nr:ribonuclease HII [Olleya aquimaris]RAJ15230.1 hypothetical protein LY08_01584 [Olleya aquimaris]
MKHFWYSFLFVLFLFSCESSSKKNNIDDFIFSDADFVLSINNLENFKSNTTNNHFITQLSKTITYKNISSELKFLNYLKSDQRIYINFFKDKKDSIQFSFATRIKDSIFTLDSLKLNREPLKLKKISAEKITENNQSIFITKIEGIVIGASDSVHLEQLIHSKTKNTSVRTLIATQDLDASFSVLINAKSPFKQLFINEALDFNSFTESLTFDAEITQNQLILNGLTKATDSLNSLINVFKNTHPQDNQLAQITPSNSHGFLSVTFDNFNTLKTNLNKYNKKDSILNPNPLFDYIKEFGEIYFSNNSAVVINSLDIYATKESLISEQENAETFREVSIYNFSNPTLFSSYLSPFIQLNEASKYCILDNFIVFSNNTETLENIIVNYQNQTTFSHRDYYQSMQTNLSDQASILQVLNPESLQNLVNLNFDSTVDFQFKDYKTTAIQFVYDSDFAHFNAVIQQNKQVNNYNSITELFNIKLDQDVLNNPQFVKNHRTKQKDIVVQDISNTLYLISNTGKILWKKQLNGPVLGKIEQIDMYKNGRLQLAFATPKRIYVLDRNGNEVKPFPMTFNDEITQPLSVFDYDNKRNYRLFVTQGKNVLLYDAKGKTVKGFNFKAANQALNSPPKHIRIGRKDYLIFKTDNKLYILDRRGKSRVSPKTNLNYSNQPVFEYNNGFATTTKDGNVVQIDQKGNVTITKTNLTDHHVLETTTRTMITQSGNTLDIKGNTLELDFGNYTSAQLFLIKNKIYVSTTDLQTQKVMLFDSNGKLINNFPVYGTSTIDLGNIDKDSKLEFVTKGETNSILVYKIN